MWMKRVGDSRGPFAWYSYWKALLVEFSDLVGLEWSGFDPQIHSIHQKAGGAPGLQCSSKSNIYYK